MVKRRGREVFLVLWKGLLTPFCSGSVGLVSICRPACSIVVRVVQGRLGKLLPIAHRKQKGQCSLCQCTNLKYLAAALMHKTCCLPRKTLGSEKSEVMSHLQCSREAIHCLLVLQAGICCLCAVCFRFGLEAR